MNKTNAAIVRTLLLGTSCLCAVSLAPAKADPTGGVVIGGSATISSNGTNTVINQTTNKAVINWDSFSISSGGSVTFNQPGTSSFTLNRVTGSAPSTIYGSLTANGNVWLINGNGVMFGKGSQINVGGLIATTSDINDQDFWNGNYAFKTGTGAAVVNQGTIKAGKRGSVVLSGSRVDNQGLIVADTGTVVLGGASSFTVDFAGDGLLKYQITQPAETPDSGKPGVSNSGTIKAPGGQVIMTARAAQAVADAVINNTGMISATSASVDQNGTVILDGGDGNVNVGGTIDASGNGSGQTGGNVSITGGNVTVADNATINASGNAGGGTIKIGGGLHGDGSVAPADNVTIGKATIKADAIKNGDGGTVVVWSKGRTDVGAAISARGGADGGNGGTVETSGHTLNIRSDTTVDTRAPKGATGNWLLDPDKIVVTDNREGGYTDLNGDGSLPIGSDAGQTDYVAPITITNALATTNVRLEAAQEIDVNSALIFASQNSLSLLSGGNINIYASIQNTLATGGGDINIIAGWDGETAIQNLLTTPGSFGSSGSEVYIHGLGADGVSVGGASGKLLVAADFVTLYVGEGPSVQLGFHGAGGGDIAVVANSDVTVTGENPTYGTNWAMIGNGAFDGSVTGAVTGNIDVKAGGTLYLLGSGGTEGNVPRGGSHTNEYAPTTAWIGNVGGVESTTGNTTIVAGDIVTDTYGLLSEMIVGDLAAGNVTIGLTDNTFYTPGVTVDSAHTLSLLSTGNMYVYNSIVNSGSGDINLVSGWDGVTLDPAHFTDAGVFGNGNHFLGIGGYGAYGDVIVGSKHGNTTVLGSYIGAWALYGNVQIGYHGAGDGNIHVESTNALYLSANYNEGGTNTLLIGNGALGGSTVGDVGGKVFVKAGGGLSLNTYYGIGCDCGANIPRDGVHAHESIYSEISIGNAGGDGAVSGSTTIIAGYFYGNYQDAVRSSILNDIAFGDVTVGTTDSTFYTPLLQFDSSHTLSLLSTGDMSVYHSVVNAGSGDINLVSGWDGTTLDPAHFGDTGVFGNNNAFLNISGGEDGILVVGSKHGNTNVFGHTVDIYAYYANTQIGYHGAGDGNITIKATGDLYLAGQYTETNSYWVHVGNGTFDGSADGNVGGNISIDVGGTLHLANYYAEGCVECGYQVPRGGSHLAEYSSLPVVIGNTQGTGSPSGSTTIFSGGIDDSAHVLSRNVGYDLYTGDVTIGIRGEYAGSLQLSGEIYTDSSHTLNLLSTGDIAISGEVRNSGSGDINMVAGWDGVTLDSAHFGDSGVFGIEGSGTIFIGGKNVEGDASIGTASGQLNVFAGNLNVEADYGLAQLGFHGVASGNINVTTTGNITVDGVGDFAVIGNGGSDVEGNVSGNISLFAGGQTAFFSDGGTSWLGNVAGDGYKETGDVTALTRYGFFRADFTSADLGTTADTGGNVFIGFYDSEAGPVFIGGFNYNAAHDFTFATAGTMQVTGLIQNGGAGAVTLVAGWDGETVGDAATIRAAGAYGLKGGDLRVGGNYTYSIGESEFTADQFSNVAVGSASGTTNLLADNVIVAPATGFYAQVGYHGTGGGKIIIDALGDLTISGGTADADFAMIGNGGNDVTGAVTGDIDIDVGGSTTITADESGTNAWIGNLATGNNFTGNVLLVTGSLDATSNFASNVASDLVGGDVTIGITDSDQNVQIEGDVAYNSSHTLSILSAGNIEVDSSIQNAGTGAINLVAGWDATTLDPAHFADMGAYGNNDGNLYIRGEGATGSVAVGSLGETNIYAASVTLVGGTGAYAQIGYHGATGGDITVHTTGSVSLDGAETTDGYAFIGNGTSYTINTAGGAVTIAAGTSINASGIQGVAGSDVSLSASDGGIGDSDNALRIAATNLSVLTHSGDVYLVSPTLGVNLSGISTKSGVFSLDAGGAITQSAAITSGTTRITTTSGDITLTDPDNGFGAITVAGPGDVSLTHLSLLTVASADVDGKLTLVAGTSIDQTGAIVAGTLDATANDGTIVLTDADNAFSALNLHTIGTNAATIADSTAVALGASSVGGVFTLHAGGAITQTGALVSAALDVEADNSGNITLTNTGNSLGQVIVQTGGNASLTDAGSIALVFANVDQKLTLTAGSAISQFSSSSVANSFAPTSSTGILAGTLDATASNGTVVLTNSNNAFSALNVHTTGSNAATITDSTGVALGASSVGGLFTLSAGGAITQTGTLTSSGLTVSTTTGNITLDDSGNSFGAADVTTPGSATLREAASIAIASADVDGTLTLNAGTSISQTGPITAGGLSATAANGGIVLTNTGNAFGSLALNATTDANVVDTTGVTLGASNVTGALTLSAGGAITQSAAVAAGTLDVTATAGDITLTDTGNSFAALKVHTTGSSTASVTDSTGLALGASSVGGLFTLSAGGAITQTGTLTANGLSVSTTTGNITIDDSGNSLGAVNVTTPGSATIREAASIAIAGADVDGTLTLNAGTFINQTGAITAGGLSATAANGGITLTDTGNAFAALDVHTIGTNIATVTDSTGLALGASSVGGLFTLSAGGAITQTGTLTSNGLTVSTSSGNITLDDSANSFGAVNVTTPGSATLREAASIAIASADVDGTLTLNAGTSISQTGAITAGAVSANASNGGVVLTDTSNAFGRLAVHATTDATIADSTGVVLGASSVTGTFTLTAGASISQAAAISAGALDLAATAGSIYLNDTGNAFAALTVHTDNGYDAAFIDSTGVALGTSSVGGIFSLHAGGAITQTGALSFGALSVAADTADITLTNANNSFGNVFVSTAGNASLTASGALVITDANVGQTLTLVAGTSISQLAPSENGPITGFNVGTLDATANNGTIVLANSGNSIAALKVHTTGSYAATIVDSTGVALGASSVGGLFTLSAGGAITETGTLTSNGLNVSATSGDITLTDANNSFGAVTVSTPGNASLTSAGALTVAYANVGRTLTLSGTSIGQTAASTAPNPPPSGIIAGMLDATATSGTIVLTSSSNSFAALDVHTTGSNTATITDATGVALGASSVGGLFTLSAGGAITQTGALTSGGLNIVNTTGSITLDNANNALGNVSLITHGSATITEAGAIAVTSASADGSLTLHGGGAITQSGAIAANGLTASTTSGGILLTNTGNAVQGPVAFSTPAAASLYNTLSTVVGVTSVGGDYTLLSKGNILFNNSVQTDGGKITAVAGWDGTTTDPAAFGNSGVYGNNSGTIVVGGQNATGAVAVGAKTGATTFYASYVIVGGINANAQLGYHGAGGGDIVVRALHDLSLNAVGGGAMLGNGSRGTDIEGNVTGNIDVRIGGNLIANTTTTPSATFSAWLGNVARNGTASGNVLLVMSDTDGTQNQALSDFAVADLLGGDVTFGFTGGGDQGPSSAIAYNSSHNLTILTAGNFGVTYSLQNSGTGAITIVAGWDGHTLDAAHFGDQGVYGNGNKGVLIGTSYATGNAALGSAGGTTSIYGATLSIAAVNGYAQLGFNGHGSGGINVTTTGGVTLTGGSGAGQFAQIGNGGLGTSGNNSGNIVIVAGGDLTLTGGAGQEAYVQIGHGGAETNVGAQQGYSNVAPITIAAANVVLNAGSGTAAYVQIGNGGYKSGLNIVGGTATNGGDITVTSGHTVSLQGNGADAYAQIGNGGSMSNYGTSASAGGTDSGNITVQAPNGANGSVTVTGGAGSNAYALIGNGGYAVNASANSTIANWTVTGDIHVTDLSLVGSGPNSFGVIGNGDASFNSYGNISGDIYIDANGLITYTNGTGPHAPGTIGNFTGHGTTGGNIYGATPPHQGEGGIGTDPAVIGVSNTNTANNSSPTNTVTVIQTVPINNDDQNENDDHTAVTATIEPPGPLASLDETNTDGSPHDADSATVIIADSLDGSGKPGPTNLLGGLLKSIPASTNAHGVPPADQDFSSWGNEALWQ
jgi:filamentous hemagglutinin family protein